MAKEYIEREAAINACYDGFADCRDDCAANIRAIPAADVVPVRHGKWEEVEVTDISENTNLGLSAIASIKNAKET